MAHTGGFYKQTKKNINMKQLLSLFLFLVPCLAWAQYPSNGNQKITLGEQTSADGLVFRGYATTDTVAATSKITRSNKQDTSAFLLLDTTTNLLWHYKIGSNAWTQAGGSTFDTTTLNLTTRFATKLNISDTASMLTPYIERGDTASMLTPYWRAGRFSGTLPVANGGTNASTFTAGSVVFAGASGTYTQDNSGLFFDNTNNRLGINTASPLGLLEARSTVGGTQNGLFSLYENSGTSPYFTFRKARGTPASPSAVQLNDGMGDLSFQGYHPDGFDNAVVLRAFNYLAPGASFLNGGFKILINSQAGGGLAERVSIISNGNFGINIAVPTEKLHVSGNARIDAVGAGTFSNNLNITSDGTLTTATSDEKFKYNIRPLKYGLSTLLQLKPVNFQWINGEDEDLGFIAQDVAEIIPEAVNTNWNSDLLFRYESLIPIFTKAIQEQQAQIEALKQRIINLENK